MTNVRILNVVPTLMCGGTENQFMTLGRLIDRTRFEVEFACLRKWGPFVKELASTPGLLAKDDLAYFEELPRAARRDTREAAEAERIEARYGGRDRRQREARDARQGGRRRAELNCRIRNPYLQGVSGAIRG